MTGRTYTHRDLAEALGVSETTIKSYRSKFPTFLPVARDGKPLRLHPEALDVCRRIRDLFAEGLSITQTHASLSTEFKEYPQNRRLSISPRAAAALPRAEAAQQDLAARLEAMALAQEQSRERMMQLEAEVRNLATLEAASKSLVAELLAELRAAKTQHAAPAAVLSAASATAPAAAPATEPAAQRQPPQEQTRPAAPPPAADAPPLDARPGNQPESTVLTARKIVTVHGQAGPLASYALNREPAPAPPFPEPELPPPAFLDLPAVIRSDRGDFLGLPGGQSVRRLVEVFLQEAATPAWFREGPDTWTCAIPLGRAQTREILFERTTTPRGNLVGLIRRMRINEAEATPVQLQEIFRQLRDQLA